MNVLIGNGKSISGDGWLKSALKLGLLAIMVGAVTTAWTSEAVAQSGSPTPETRFLDPRDPLLGARPPQTVYINPSNNYVTVQVRLVQLYYSYWDPNAKVAVYNKPVSIYIPGVVAQTVYTDGQGVASLYVNNLPAGTQQFTCYVSFAGGGYNGTILNPASASFAIIRQSPF
ncbi:hypothetical protein [Bremerella cremea]|uniref:hypothetical protein n=1 Tax=Bremerella cremea TaxID=1031537 RepID=UPI0031EB3573